MTVTSIQACAVKHQGGQAEPFSYDSTIDAHDVLVRITHCSVATGDVQFIDNEWGDTRYPLVPGHEMVGLVEEAGSAVTGLRVGDRVGIGYQQAACFSCEFCLDGSEHLCASQKVIGVHCYGGIADHIVVDSRFAFKLPPTLDSARSTPLLSAGLTVYTAISRAGLRDASTVAVMGIGGLGHLAIQFLRHMGHTVAAFSHSPAKQETIERLGATYVDSSVPPSVTRAKGSFDLILSTLNTAFDLNAYLGMLRPQGKFCFVAQPLEALPIRVGILYDNAQRTIYGNYVGGRKDMTAMLAFAAERGIESIVEIMPFTSVNRAIELVRSGQAPMRVVLQR